MPLVISLVLFSGTLLQAHAQARPATQPGAPTAISLYCYAPGVSANTIYFSNIFTVPINSYAGANTAFNQYLVEKYSYKGQAMCAGGATVDQAKSGLQANIDGFQKQNIRVVQTGWTFDPNAAPAAARGANPNAGPTPSTPAVPSPGPAPAAAQTPASPPPSNAAPVRTPRPAESNTAAKGATAPAPNSARAQVPAQPATGSLQTYCFTNPEKPTIYVSDVFDTGIPASESQTAGTFLKLLDVAFQFDDYLKDKYGVPVPEPEKKDASSTICLTLGPIQLVQQKRQQWMNEQQAARKKLITTEWKFTPGRPETTSTPTPPPAAAPAGPGVLTWKQITRKDQLTDETWTETAATTTIGNPRAPTTLTANTKCSSTGFRVILSVSDNIHTITQPPFSWAKDDDGNDFIPMRTRIDTGSAHQTIAYADSDGDGPTRTQYVNAPVLFFYDARGVEYSTNNGVPLTGVPLLDNAFGNLTREASKAAAQKIEDEAAGSLAQFVNASSIRVEIPLLDGQLPIIDLNPRDRVLQDMARKCYTKLGGR